MAMLIRVVTVVFHEYTWEVLNQPLYSPDQSPQHYNLFSKLKELLRGICFSDLRELSSAMTQKIRLLNKN